MESLFYLSHHMAYTDNFQLFYDELSNFVWTKKAKTLIYKDFYLKKLFSERHKKDTLRILKIRANLVLITFLPVSL